MYADKMTNVDNDEQSITLMLELGVRWPENRLNITNTTDSPGQVRATKYCMKVAHQLEPFAFHFTVFRPCSDRRETLDAYCGHLVRIAGTV